MQETLKTENQILTALLPSAQVAETFCLVPSFLYTVVQWIPLEVANFSDLNGVALYSVAGKESLIHYFLHA